MTSSDLVVSPSKPEPNPVSESAVAPTKPTADPAGHAGSATTAPVLRFIPFRRDDVLRMLAEEGALPTFDAGAALIAQHFAEEFHGLRQTLKNTYAAHDPDADTRAIALAAEEPAEATALVEQLATLLNRGNYEVLTDADLKRAFRHASLFQISLKVDMKDFDEVLVYCRGASERTETLALLGGLFRRPIRFLNYERVLLYLRFADRGESQDPEFPAGRVMVKLFQNVPDADLEMLFPNTQVAMRWTDRLLIGVPALASGAVVAFTKLGAPLLLLGALFGFWLGLYDEPVSLDRNGLLVLAAGFGALGAYLWKQISNYRNRKARFRQTLTRNLYFKLLDNNAGALLRILDDAEDSECKEAWIALYFLLRAEQPLSAGDLDARIEDWFRRRWQAVLDFEIEDALSKLARLDLAQERDGMWSTVAPEPGNTVS